MLFLFIFIACIWCAHSRFFAHILYSFFSPLHGKYISSPQCSCFKSFFCFESHEEQQRAALCMHTPSPSFRFHTYCVNDAYSTLGVIVEQKLLQRRDGLFNKQVSNVVHGEQRRLDDRHPTPSRSTRDHVGTAPLLRPTCVVSEAPLLIC